MREKTRQRLEGRSRRHNLRLYIVGTLQRVAFRVSLAAGLVFGIVALVHLRQTAIDLAASRADNLALLAAHNIESTKWSQSLLDDPRIVGAHIVNGGGEILTNAIGPASGQIDPIGHPHPESWSSIVVEEPLRVDGQVVGTLCLVAVSTPTVKQASGFAAALLLLTIVTMVASRATANRAYRRISDNLLDLTHVANAIAARQDYSIRALRRSDDELGLLADTFNQMIGQVQLRENRLQSAVRRAEQAKLAKAQFLATMSHEIRTPINGVLGMAQLLLDTELTTEQIDFAKTIDKSASNLLKIINDILEFSKGEAACYVIEEIPFSPADLISESLTAMSTIAAEQGLELFGHAEPSIPPQLRGDPARIRQVILNLISNALKFTHRGEVRVRATLESDLGDAVAIRIEVTDSGIGIPADRLDRLFRSFSQVDSSNNRQFGGTGLGLAISRQIVEAMGGSISVETEVGKGSTFGFCLELPKESVQGDAHAPVPSGMRILVVERSAGIRESLQSMLSENEVKLCDTGLAGRKTLLDAPADTPFDLVLLDGSLSEDFGMTERGHDIPFPKIPLILVTPITRLKPNELKSWSGPTSSISKPLNQRDLYWCIAELRPGHMAPARKAAPKDTFANDERLLSVKVLVVEDHPVNQRITTRFLEKIGASWVLADNGEQAVEAFERDTFDLILMDVQMPVMDGIQATMAIRKLELERGGHVPIIAMTASVLDEDRREREEAEFDDFVPKPVQFGELEKRVRQWGHPARELNLAKATKSAA